MRKLSIRDLFIVEIIGDIVLIFKILVTLTYFIFIFFISDFQNKKTEPLFPKPWLTIMRIGYLIPPSCFLFFLWKLSKITLNSILTLSMLICGLLIVLIAKKELGKRHAWAGYAAKHSNDYCVTGIYAWIRHPLYLGIIVAVTGMAFIVIPGFNLQIQLACTYLIGSVITFIFLFISSNKETVYLSKKFGAPFINYARQVNAFLPIRKYREI